jgi:hypothetical protein
MPCTDLVRDVQCRRTYNNAPSGFRYLYASSYLRYIVLCCVQPQKNSHLALTHAKGACHGRLMVKLRFIVIDTET